MRKKVKTLVALGLVVCTLIGCGSQTGTSTEQEQSSQVASVQSQTQASGEEQESAYPDYLNLESYRPIVKEDEEITLKLAVKRSAHATNDLDDVWFIKFIEDELNINLEIEEVTKENMAERKNLMLASGELPDMMIWLGFSTSDVMKYGVDEELFLPLSDYFSEELTPSIMSMLEENDAAVALNTAPNGKMYTLPEFLDNTDYSDGSIARSRVFVDTKYLEAAGIEELPDTLDGFVDMLRKFRDLDPADLGVDEIVPVAEVNGLVKQYIQNAFGWILYNATSVDAAWDVEMQEVVVPVLTDKYEYYLKVMNTLYSEGLLHPDYFTMDSAAVKALFSERKTGVMGNWAPYLTQPEAFDEWVSLKPLKSEWNEEGVTCIGQAYSLGKVLISADTEYPELCMRLLDYFYSPEGSTYSYYGAPAGSDDTLGMMNGYEIVDGNFKFGDVGQYESDYVYRCNVVNLFEINFYGDLAKETAYDLAGVKMVNTEIDSTDPDNNYRVKVKEAFTGPMEDALPSAYVATDISARYADLKTVINSYVTAETAKFITGQRPLSEFKDFQAELKELGSEEYLESVKSFYENYERPEY